MDIDIPVRLGSAQMVIDVTTGQVCEMSACDNSQPQKNQAYMWRNPAYRAAHDEEARARGFTKKDMSYAWDKTKWVNVTPQRVMARVRDLVKQTKKKNPPK